MIKAMCGSFTACESTIDHIPPDCNDVPHWSKKNLNGDHEWEKNLFAKHFMYCFIPFIFIMRYIYDVGQLKNHMNIGIFPYEQNN